MESARCACSLSFPSPSCALFPGLSPSPLSLLSAPRPALLFSLRVVSRQEPGGGSWLQWVSRPLAATVAQLLSLQLVFRSEAARGVVLAVRVGRSAQGEECGDGEERKAMKERERERVKGEKLSSFSLLRFSFASLSPLRLCASPRPFPPACACAAPSASAGRLACDHRCSRRVSRAPASAFFATTPFSPLLLLSSRPPPCGHAGPGRNSRSCAEGFGRHVGQQQEQQQRGQRKHKRLGRGRGAKTLLLLLLLLRLYEEPLPQVRLRLRLWLRLRLRRVRCRL